ncbi:MAG TPA: polyprenyl diphosphate synthase, partial [Clostridia bacterium]|nr:polyprenyl diphosphate synthase [Clostridia bacterium]
MALWKRKPQPDWTPEPNRLPRHVAVIMDGNGRWATRRGMPRAMGHRSGVEAMRAVIRESSDLGVEALTFYAFSTENWTRSNEEVGVLMALLLEYFAKELDELNENRVRIRIIGDLDGLPAPQRGACLNAMERTRDNPGLKLNL